MFEERLFALVGILHKISEALTEEGIGHELIGGLAVLIHVEEANPEHATLTRDVDLMVYRSDLERIKQSASKYGFRYRCAEGVDMLLFGPSDSMKNAVHLVFSGERVRPNYPAVTPQLRQSERKFTAKKCW